MKLVAATVLIILDITGAYLVRVILLQTGNIVLAAVGFIFSVVIDAMVLFINFCYLRQLYKGTSLERLP